MRNSLRNISLSILPVFKLFDLLCDNSSIIINNKCSSDLIGLMAMYINSVLAIFQRLTNEHCWWNIKTKIKKRNKYYKSRKIKKYLLVICILEKFIRNKNQDTYIYFFNFATSSNTHIYSFLVTVPFRGCCIFLIVSTGIVLDEQFRCSSIKFLVALSPTLSLYPSWLGSALS